MSLALAAVFTVGAAASALYYRLEIREIRDELHQAFPGDLARVDAALSSLHEIDYEYLGFVFLPLALLCAIVIVRTSVWSLRPILRAARSLQAADSGTGRLNLQELPIEVRPFADSVNSALNRSQEAYEAERRFVANAAHELRTPVAVLALRVQKARIEGVPDWSALERDVSHLTRVVDQLLELARKEAGAKSEAVESVNLARTTREAAALVLPLAEQLGREVEVVAPDSVLVRGHPGNLCDMLRNILENALLHGRGRVRAEVLEENRSGQSYAIVLIADEGVGVPAALRDAVFERFRKGDATSPGAGLGLAIVREVIRAHGGDVEFLPTEQCRVKVQIPRAP